MGLCLETVLFFKTEFQYRRYPQFSQMFMVLFGQCVHLGYKTMSVSFE